MIRTIRKLAGKVIYLLMSSKSVESLHLYNLKRDVNKMCEKYPLNVVE